MADKEKLLSNAQKFISKGQISKAVSEYQALVKAFPKDVRNRQKLAELLSRDKRNDEALKEYEVVAKHYTDTGFYLKAIAVFKQMQRIDPSQVDIYQHLAELNEKQGLIGNALTEYRNLVAHYDKNGMRQDALNVLEKMLAIDPGNLNVSAKIAECYMALGRNEEAFEKLQEVIAPLVANAEHAKIIKLYERFLDICPEQGTTRLPLARALLDSGSTEKATQILKNLLKHSPDNTEINLCLTDAYVASHDFANARLTLKHLLKQHEDDLALREYYVRVCIDAGEAERARDQLEEWKDAFYEADRMKVLQGYYAELSKLIPDDAQVAETRSFIDELLDDQGNRDRQPVAEEVSDETPATADDMELEVTFDDGVQLESSGEEAFAESMSPDRDELPDDFSAEKTAAVGVELDLDVDFDVSEPPSAENVTPAEPLQEMPLTEAVAECDLDEDLVEVEVELDLEGMDDLELEFDEELPVTESVAEFIEEDDMEDEPSLDVVLADAESEMDAVAELPTPDELYEAYDEEDEVSLLVEDLDFDIADQVGTVDHGSADISSEETRIEVLEEVQEEFLEEPECFAEQEPEQADEPEALTELAADQTEEPEALYEAPELTPFDALQSESPAESLPEPAEIPAEIDDFEIIEEIDALDEAEDIEDLEEIEDIEALEDVAEGAEPPAPTIDFAAALNVEAELEEAQFYLQQGLYDDAERVVETLLEYRPEMPELLAKLDEIRQGRQSAESEAESAAFVDLMADLQEDDLLAATNFLDSFDSSHTDDELTQKLVSELDSSDTESHYNLGIAYKEMGLYGDAIAEFEKAGQDPARSVDCISLTGQCYMETGDNEAAMAAFKRGLAHENLTAEGRMTLVFELGMLHQMNGELLEALDCFQLVAEKDSFYRDVAELIKNLRKELGLDDSDDDGGPQGNRDRVSYV